MKHVVDAAKEEICKVESDADMERKGDDGPEMDMHKAAAGDLCRTQANKTYSSFEREWNRQGAEVKQR